jgi:hypothetical protein
MAETTIYDLPYPVLSDPVDIVGDIKSLAERMEAVLFATESNVTIEVTNVSGVSIAIGDPVYVSGFNSDSGKPEVTKLTNTMNYPLLGLAKSEIATTTDGVVVISGIFSNVATSSYSFGNILYTGTSGGLTATQPATGGTAVGVVAKSHATTGVIIVGKPTGNGSWAALKAGLA